MVSRKDIAIIGLSIIGIAGLIVIADYVQVQRAAQANPLACIKGAFFEGNPTICRINDAITKLLPFLGLFT